MEIKILDISHSGEGVGKIDGKVIFVPKVDIGEIVEVKKNEETKNYDKGEVTEIISPSRDRIEPLCPYFKNCNGCDFQFLTYERELWLKTKILQKELKKVNFFEKIEVFPSKNRYFYRNKIKLSYQNGKLGYIANGNFLEVGECVLANKQILKAVKVLQKYFEKQNYTNLKSVTLRSINSDALIAFLFEKEEKFFYHSLLDDYSVGVFVGKVLENDKTKLILEFNKKIEKNYKNFKIPVDFKSFFQINDEIADKLYEYILSLVGAKKIISAYSGQGILTRLLSSKCDKIVGIEVQRTAHKIAEQIKSKNMTNVCGLVEKELPKIIKKEKFDAIILDPAREGCQKSVIYEILNAKIKEIIYVSCNFSTLVRDLKLLGDRYEIENVALFDMFPNTCNMETCVKLKLK